MRRGRPGEAAAPPALVAVAHGTRHPAGPATVDRLLDGVRRRLPGVEVAGAYVELVYPGVGEVLAALRRPAVVVPLLLSAGYHVRTDLPAAVAEASAPVTLAAPLGPSAALTTALLDRVRQAGAVSGDPVVLGAAGSSDPAASAAVRRAGRLLARIWRGPVTCGFLSLARPDLGAALDRAVRRTTRPVTVAPYLLSPGRFAVDLARLADERGARAAAVLGDHPALADLVVGRYLEHAAVPSSAQAG
ncbi:MAG: sirohydrochlorin chelatase [Actinomycetota bacterium]|nr:sirohydrochlorin chelatase [Actinomycetota bacterium]